MTIKCPAGSGCKVWLWGASCGMVAMALQGHGPNQPVQGTHCGCKLART